jgi:hypothetical protein
MMDRKPVASAALAAVGYDPTTGDLEIEFRTGRIYRYSDVPSAMHEWLLRTRNKGVFVSHHLSGRYGEQAVSDSRTPPEVPLERALRESLARLETPSASDAPAPNNEPLRADDAQS